MTGNLNTEGMDAVIAVEEKPKRRTAAPWIKWTIGFSWKPEVVLMARVLNLHRREVATLCMEIWEWADANADEAGNVRGVTSVTLDERIGVTGFADALKDAGWLLEDDEGVIFVNYDRHNGNNAKNRAQIQKRVKNHRRP